MIFTFWVCLFSFFIFYKMSMYYLPNQTKILKKKKPPKPLRGLPALHRVHSARLSQGPLFNLHTPPPPIPPQCSGNIRGLSSPHTCWILSQLLSQGCFLCLKVLPPQQRLPHPLGLTPTSLFHETYPSVPGKKPCFLARVPHLLSAQGSTAE